MKPAATIVRSTGPGGSREAAPQLLPRCFTAASSLPVLLSLSRLCWRGGAAARRSRAAPYWAVAHPTGGGGRQDWPATWPHWSDLPSCSAAHHQPGASRRRLGGLSASSKSRPRRTTSSLQRRCRSCWRLLLRANVADLMLFSSCKRNTFSLHCLALRADQLLHFPFLLYEVTHTHWCQFSTGGFPILSRGGVSMHGFQSLMV